MNPRLVALAMALGACTAAHAGPALSFQNLNGVTTNYNTPFPSGTQLYEEMAWLFTSLSNTGSNLTYLQWMADAGSDYNRPVNGFTTPDYSNWMILTDVANQTAKTQGIGNQELLAYDAPSSVGIVTTFTAIPEPGTVSMLAIGLGLLLAGMKLRARSGTRAEAGRVLRS